MRDECRLLRGTWVVVADCRKALLLENEGRPDHPDLQIRQVIEAGPERSVATRDTTAGNQEESAGAPARNAGREQERPTEAVAFAKTLACRMSENARSHRITGFVVVAAPRFLGVLRVEFDATTRSLIRAEIDRDLVNLPVAEIQRQLVRTA